MLPTKTHGREKRPPELSKALGFLAQVLFLSHEVISYINISSISVMKD